MDPFIGGSLISAGGSLLGGLLGKSSADKRAKQTAALAREMAQYGIRWKVKDAKKAGIHPLYALGASSNISPTLPAGDTLGASVAEAAASVGRGMVGKKQSELIDQQIQESKSRQMLNEAQSVALAGQDTARQGARTFGDANLDVAMGVQTWPPPDSKQEIVEVVPTQVPTTKPGDRSTKAGNQPFFVEYTRKDGTIGRALNPDLGMDEVGQVYVAAAEGKHWAKKMWTAFRLTRKMQAKIADYARRKRLKALPKPPAYYRGK